MNKTSGIHHVTAIASDAQNNLDFYTGVLGLRLVKQTVNFDDPTSYHFYYGNTVGAPGTILTYFVWPGGRRTREGYGEVNTTSLAVPQNSLGWWKQRFNAAGVQNSERPARFGEEVLQFLDPDGMKFELIATPDATDDDFWAGSGIAVQYAIRGVHSVTLTVARQEPTAQVLTERLGYTRGETDDLRTRFVAGVGEEIGRFVDVVTVPDAPHAGGGVGAVHHVAFRAENDETQAQFQGDLLHHNLQVSAVMDRSYFHSIYFREPGGVLFEIATDSPGFATDESVDNLGTVLQLPPQYEKYREQIQAGVQPIVLPKVKEQK